MEINDLKIFCRIYDRSSISLAAKDLFLSQPSVTHKLKTLETELDLILFERNNKGVLATAAGRVVYDYARNILSLADEMLQDLTCYGHNHVNRLKLLSSATFGQYALPCSLFEYKKKAGKPEIELEYAHSSEIISQIRDCLVDVGFIEGIVIDDEIDCLQIGKSKALFVASPKLNCDPQMTHEALSQYSFMALSNRSTLRHLIDNTLLEYEVRLDKLKRVESPSVESIKSSVISGQGIAVLPYMAVKKDLYTKNLVSFNVDSISFEYPISLIFRKTSKKISLIDFVNFIRFEGIRKLC